MLPWLMYVTGAQDRDANVRTKAVAIVGAAAANAEANSEQSHVQLMLALLPRQAPAVGCFEKVLATL